MNYITIASLKKQAKKERKLNNNIKNHAESLNLIALKHNFKDWDELINNSVILNKESENPSKSISFKFKQTTPLTILIEHIFERHLELVETFKMKNYKYLSYFIFENYKLRFDQADLMIERGRTFIEFISYVYTKVIPKNKDIDLDLFYALSDFKELLNIVKNNNLYEDKKIKHYLDSIPGFFNEHDFMNNDSDLAKEQFGYTKSLFNSFFNDIEQINLDFKKDIDFKNKLSILNNLKELINFPSFMSNTYFNKNYTFENYLLNLHTDKKVSLFDKDIIKRHNEEVDFVLKLFNNK